MNECLLGGVFIMHLATTNKCFRCLWQSNYDNSDISQNLKKRHFGRSYQTEITKTFGHILQTQTSKTFSQLETRRTSEQTQETTSNCNFSLNKNCNNNYSDVSVIPGQSDSVSEITQYLDEIDHLMSLTIVPRQVTYVHNLSDYSLSDPEKSLKQGP